MLLFYFSTTRTLRARFRRALRPQFWSPDKNAGFASKWTLRVFTVFKGFVPEKEESEARPGTGRAERAGRDCRLKRSISGSAQASFGTKNDPLFHDSTRSISGSDFGLPGKKSRHNIDKCYRQNGPKKSSIFL